MGGGGVGRQKDGQGSSRHIANLPSSLRMGGIKTNVAISKYEVKAIKRQEIFMQQQLKVININHL